MGCCAWGKYRMDYYVKSYQTIVRLLGGKLGGVGEGVVLSRVGEVVCQVLDGALAGDNSLDKEAQAGKHSLQMVQQCPRSIS